MYFVLQTVRAPSRLLRHSTYAFGPLQSKGAWDRQSVAGEVAVISAQYCHVTLRAFDCSLKNLLS